MSARRSAPDPPEPSSGADPSGPSWAAVLAVGSALTQPSPVSIAVIDADATVRHVSPEGMRVMDPQPEPPSGTGAFDWLHPDDLQQGRRAFTEAWEQPGTAVTMQVRALTPAGSYRWVEAVVANLLTEPEVGAVVLHARDLTEWKRGQVEVLEREARLQLLLEQLPATLWTTDHELRMTLAVGGGYASVPWDPTDLVGRTVMEVSGEITDPGPVVSGHLRALSGGVSTYSADWGGRTWRCHVEPLRDGEGRIGGTIGVSLDITESTLAAEQLERSIHALRRIGRERRELISRLVSAQEDERIRVAREMHDHIGQLLASGAMLAKSVQEEAAGTELEASIGHLRQLMEQAQVSTRSIVASLRAVDLEEEGLRGAIAHLAEEVRQRHRIEVHVHVVGLDEHLGKDRQIAVYRIVQEALANAIKHAAPTAVSIVGSVRRGRVQVLVEDDGRGFWYEDVMRGPLAGRLGILGMQERATAVGGDIYVESRPGAGTTLRVRIPWEEGR
jgi:PAS domain S-box-containing protein